MFRRYLEPFQLLHETPGAGGGGGNEGRSETAQDLADLESEDPPETEEDQEGEESEEEDETGQAEEDEEGEEEEGDEEEEESEEREAERKPGRKEADTDSETDESGRPTVRAIKAKYPEIFKDFPTLKTAFFQLPKFLDVFADPEQAVEASMKAREYDVIEQSLVDRGDPSLLFNTLSDNNPRALKKLVDNLPEAIRGVDQNLYLALSTPIVEELLYHATNHANKTGNKNLLLSARHLANFVFANGGEIPDITKRGGKQEPSEAERQLEEERLSHRNEKYQTMMTDMEAGLTADLDSVIGRKLTDLNPFERKQVIKDTRHEIDQALKVDATFQRVLRSLFKRAHEDYYSEDSKSRIKRAWLDRARTLAPGIRNRLRQEALDARSGKGDSGKEKVKKRSFPNQGGRSSGRSSSGFVDPKKINWKKTSDLDILNG